MKVWQPHSVKQETAYFSEKKIKIIATGIQWGKTTVNAMCLKEAMHTYTDSTDNFIMTAPNYKIMQQATLPEFLKVMEGWGEYSKADACFRMYNGGTCWMRTATNPDSVVGITNVRFITGDEAGLFPLYFHENLQARASFKQAPIMYTTSPYSLNWLYKDYIRPITKKGVVMDDVLLIQARSDENPYFPKEEFLRKKATMDPRRFNMIYGGEFNKVEGLVYDCFQEDTHVIDRHELPSGTIVLAGVDWGYTHPAVILVVALMPNGKIRVIDEWYHTQKTIAEMVEAAEKLKYIHKIERFYCDPSQPAHIEQMNRAKLTAIPADNKIRAGIDAVYEFIKSDKFHIFRGVAPNLLDELSMYHYELFDDYKPDQDVKERMPVMQNDHACFSDTALVRTRVGMRSIADIKVGDKVLTPIGYREVLESGKTGIRNVNRYYLEDGRTIDMTEDHPCLSSDFTFDAARYCDSFIACDTKDTNTILTGAIGVGLALKNKALSIFTGRYGKTTLERYLRIAIFTIKTITHTIMNFLTLNVSMQKRICHITTNHGQIDHYQNMHFLKQPSGIEVKRAKNGTQSMENTLINSGNLKTKYVTPAEKNLNASTTADSARIIVSRSIGVSIALMTKLERVMYVKKIMSSIGIVRPRPVAVNAVLPLGQKNVYNLKIKGASSFYCNGIVVSNCDALRYILYALKRTKHINKTGVTMPGVSQQDHRLHISDKLILNNLNEDYDW